MVYPMPINRNVGSRSSPINASILMTARVGSVRTAYVDENAQHTRDLVFDEERKQDHQPFAAGETHGDAIQRREADFRALEIRAHGVALGFRDIMLLRAVLCVRDVDLFGAWHGRHEDSNPDSVRQCFQSRSNGGGCQ